MPSFFFHVAIDLKTWAPDSRTLHSRDIFKPQPLGTARRTESSAQCTAQRIDVSRVRLVVRSQHGENPQGTEGKLKGDPEKTAVEQSYDSLDDWRLGKVSLQHIEMLGTSKGGNVNEQSTELMHLSHGIGAGPNGLATKGRYEPSEIEDEELGWGIVRLYRDAEETPGLYEDPVPAKSSKHGKSGGQKSSRDHHQPFRDEDCTTLCILAVPSYLTPSDFLGFVGEKTREEVSHFRMIRTERSNRYMVLMKFRIVRRAREWRKEWNGKVFNSMEVSRPLRFFVQASPSDPV